MTTKAAILKAIRHKCLDCSCRQPSEVRNCRLTGYDLWPYRLGRDPEPGPARGAAKSPLLRNDFEAEEAVSRSLKRNVPASRWHASRDEIQPTRRDSSDGDRTR